MRAVSSDTNRLKVLEAFAVSLFFILVFYPGFLFLQTTPMSGLGWELQDPVVSFANFEPSFKVFQYELMHHKNLLWSNLRSMGLPLLANDVHAAPMFPLTLLLFWVPVEYFWNIFVVARLFFMGVGTYLLAREFLKFRSIPSMFFVLCFVYSMFVLRWMNHSWQNGLLAGIWYLYFLYQVLGQSRSPYGLKRFLIFLGLVFCVYSMVTCGFPEASAMFAVLVVLVYVPFVISMIIAGKVQMSHFLFDLVVAHAVGFALSAAQIFSIFEMLSLYEGAERRAMFGLRQFALQDFFPFWAEKIALITGSEPTLFRDSRTYFGLVPLFFFLVGIAWTVRNVFRISYRQVGALVCGIFIVLKFFPFWPAFNQFVGSLPVLRESYFFVYFLSIFLWFFAFFVAQGVQVFLYENRSGTVLARYGWRLFSLVSAVTVFVLVWISVPVVYQMTFPEFLKNTQGSVHLVVLFVFCASFAVVQIFLNSKKKNRQTVVAGALLLTFSVIELSVILPSNFRELPLGITKLSNKLAQDMTDKGISLAEVRITDPHGEFVSGGIATIDNGAPAVLPHRLVVFRQNMFEVPWGGYLPLRKAKYKYSWALTSTALFYSNENFGPVSVAYEQMQQTEEGYIFIDNMKVDGKGFEKEQESVSGSQLIYARGWAVDTRNEQPSAPSVFVVFRSGESEISFPARKIYREDIANHFSSQNVVYAGWEFKADADLLPPGRYEILVRWVRTGGSSYFEKIAEKTLTVLADAGNSENSIIDRNRRYSHLSYVATTRQGFIYYNKNALPRAYLAGRCFAVNDYVGAVKGITDKENFILGDVFVEELSEREKKLCQDVSNQGPKRVSVSQDLGKEVQLGSVLGPGVLVLNDNYYPGWQAFDQISGERLQIKPANITLRSLVLPEKREYRIIFQYIPAWLGVVRILLWTAGLVLAALFCFSLPCFKAKQESG